VQEVSLPVLASSASGCTAGFGAFCVAASLFTHKPLNFVPDFLYNGQFYVDFLSPSSGLYRFIDWRFLKEAMNTSRHRRGVIRLFMISSTFVLAPTVIRADQKLIPALPKNLPACVTQAPAGYRGKACLQQVDRTNPISPPTLVVPGRTTIYVELDNPRWDETVLFNTAVSQAALPNFLSDLLTSLGSPISGLQTSMRSMNSSLTTNILPLKNLAVTTTWHDQANQLTDLENWIADALNAVNPQVQLATSQLTCLESHNVFVSNACDQTQPLGPATLQTAVTAAISAAQTAATLPLPLSQITRLNASLTTFDAQCQALTDAADKSPCIDASNKLLSTAARQANVVKDIQTLQDTLSQVATQLGKVSLTPATLYFEITQPFMRTATVTITGTEVVTKTATTIATVTINWSESGFLLSTGVMGTGIAYKTYALSSEIVGGTVQVDPANPTKNLSKVIGTSVRPNMDFPAVFGHWVIPWLNRWSWENACPSHCGFMLSGGAALNLNTKTADFAVGPSIQVLGLMITPALVFGRQSVLADGITVGYTGFGSNPPTSLPTAMAWKKAFGLALTYTIPTQ
jgi:hypothetical protein